MKRIYFRHWGNRKHLKIPAYAVENPIDFFDNRAGAVAAAIARKNGLKPIGMSHQGYCIPDNADHFEITFGTKCRTGGWNVEATLWVSIKRGH